MEEPREREWNILSDNWGRCVGFVETVRQRLGDGWNGVLTVGDADGKPKNWLRLTIADMQLEIGALPNAEFVEESEPSFARRLQETGILVGVHRAQQPESVVVQRRLFGIRDEIYRVGTEAFTDDLSKSRVLSAFLLDLYQSALNRFIGDTGP